MGLWASSKLSLRRLILGYSGGGAASLRAKLEGFKSNILLDKGAFVNEQAWLSCLTENAKIHIGEGTRIRSYAQIHADGGFVKMGRRCLVNSFCVLNGAGGLTIGDDVLIAAQTTIITGNHAFDDPSRSIRDQAADSTQKGVLIGDDVWMGFGVRIMDGVKIGSHSVLAAGAVITHDVPENSVVAGVPGRVLRKRGEKK